MTLNQSARVQRASMADLMRDITQPGPNARWLMSNSDALARIRAEREAENMESNDGR